MKKVGFLVLIILLIDQFSKIYVKTHFHLNESINVFGLDWFKITYVENPGAAYGLKLGGHEGKILLVILRIILVGFIIWWIRKNIKLGANNYYLIPMGMILAGAIGNLLDGIFYSQLFDFGTIYNATTGEWDISPQDTFRVAKLNFEGYNAPFLGCVVDMLHFPLFSGTYPDWLPFLGGKNFNFFSYIFNIADSSITLGLTGLILFRKRFPKL